MAHRKIHWPVDNELWYIWIDGIWRHPSDRQAVHETLIGAYVRIAKYEMTESTINKMQLVTSELIVNLSSIKKLPCKDALILSLRYPGMYSQPW